MALMGSQSRREKEPFGWDSFVRKLAAEWLQPSWQARFAVVTAITILSFALVDRGAGVPVQQFQPGHFNSMRIWHAAEDKVIRVRDRAVKYYENMRFVYQLERRLKDLQEYPKTSKRASAPSPESERRNDWPEELASRKHTSQLAQCSESCQ